MVAEEVDYEKVKAGSRTFTVTKTDFEKGKTGVGILTNAEAES